MTITLNGTSGINTPGVVNTAAQTVATTLAVTGVSTLTGGFTVGATAAPAFSAYMGSTQALSAVTSTKLQYNTENFDTASCYNNTGSTVGGIPAYAFLPNVAGYYQINANFSGATSTSGDFQISILKNGISVALNGFNAGTSGGFTNAPCISALIQFNGSTDYVEIWAYVQSAQTLQSGANRVFSGSMVRSA